MYYSHAFFQDNLGYLGSVGWILLKDMCDHEHSIFLGFVFGPLEFSRRDLMAVNMQRARDHGLPDYNSVRQSYGLTRIENFSDINQQLDPAVRPVCSFSCSGIGAVVCGIQPFSWKPLFSSFTISWVKGFDFDASAFALIKLFAILCLVSYYSRARLYQRILFQSSCIFTFIFFFSCPIYLYCTNF